MAKVITEAQGPNTRQRLLAEQTVALSSSSTPSPSFRLTYHTGDLTTTPPSNAILIHSCNCLGEWGSGVALAMKHAFPAAYDFYAAHCQQQQVAADLLGTCLLIPPQEMEMVDDDEEADGRQGEKWIACLFTSEGYGRKTKSKPGKSKAADIIRYTNLALEALRKELEGYCDDTPTTLTTTPDDSNKGTQPKHRKKRQKRKPNVQELWACKFNSGSFGIKWETTTVPMIERVFNDWEGEMKIVIRPP